MSEVIFYLICGVVLVMLYGLCRYYKLDGEIMRKAAELIPQAEEVFQDKDKSGEEKMRWVMERITEYIPIFLKIFFTKDRVQSMIQFVFDNIAKLIKTG